MARDLLRSSFPGRGADEQQNYRGDLAMQWSKPEYTELRFGFEITMYINNR
jgi:coenzyme PQQ precursor peptide PqqA